ncbi:alanine/glycine:cation symporter family protein [Faecalimonas sp.]
MFNQFLSSLNDFLYSYILIFLLVLAGLYFSFRTKFVQFRLFKDAILALKEKSGNNKKSVSSFQALMISTASRVGTGNIAGIATAIVAGGPGAVFWMWVMALIGGASAFVESTLAQVYKVKDGKTFRGGPSYYIEQALGKRYLGVLFSILLIACFAYGFNGLQTYNMSSALEYYIPNYSKSILPAIVGLIIAFATAFVIFGGVHRISFITSVIVPIMAGIYILMGIFITLMNWDQIPKMFSEILEGAFNFKAIFGGFAGSTILIGIKRGLFSNEAGMGSAPNASASAEVSHPVKQGMVQVISVFIDTLLICTTTAFILLLSNVEGTAGKLDGIPYVQAALQANVGEIGIHFITFSIFAFAFTSLIGNYYYAESNILFIKDNKVLLFLFRISCLVAIFFGAQADFSTVWNLADILMGFMAIENILVIFVLGNIAFKVLDDYTEQKKQGVNPVFKAKKIGLKNTNHWK